MKNANVREWKNQMNDEDYFELYRGENISVEQMCGLLPKVFEVFDEVQAITVCPYPIYSKKNGDGTEILVLSSELGGVVIIPIAGLMQDVITQ